MYIFRVILTCDRRYTNFDLKLYNKTYIKDLISKNFRKKRKKFFKNSKSDQI